MDNKQPKGSYAASNHNHDDRYYSETEVNNKFNNITWAVKLFSGRFNQDKLDTNLYATDIVSRYYFLVLHQDYNNKVVNYMVPTSLLFCEQTFLLYGGNTDYYWCHLTTDSGATMKAYCSTDSRNLYFELYGVGIK